MLFLKHNSPGPKTKARKSTYARSCNICGDRFIARTPHRCFCDNCKASSDLYRFHDWLPDAVTDSEAHLIAPPAQSAGKAA